jgi:hypothetical protein
LSDGKIVKTIPLLYIESTAFFGEYGVFRKKSGNFEI